MRPILATCSIRAAVIGWLVLAGGSAAAAPLRTPQVPFDPSVLRQVLASRVDPADLTAGQLAVQSWMPGVTTGQYVAMSPIVLVAIQGGTRSTLTASVGLCSGSGASTAFQMLFPPGAGPGWSAVCAIDRKGLLGVQLSDETGNIQGFTTAPGFDPAHFGFYVGDGPQRRYSEDARNAGAPQALVFPSPLLDCGDSTECVAFETAPFVPGSSTFSGVVLQWTGEPFATDCGWDPTPVHRSTWGSLKAVYR